MTVHLAIVFYEHGFVTVGVFEEVGAAKLAVERVVNEPVLLPEYGEATSGTVIDLVLNRIYTGEDEVGMSEYNDIIGLN